MTGKEEVIVLEISVTFSIPEWFPPDRCDKREAVMFSAGHLYAGSYSHEKNWNTATDALFRLKEVKEVADFFHVVCIMPVGTRNKSRWIKKTGEKLDRFFNRYKEGS